MSRNRLMSVLGVLIAVTMIVSACAPKAATFQPANGKTGAWIDSITFTNQNDQSAGVKQLQAGDIQMYMHGMDNPDLFKTVKADTNLAYSTAAGSSDELTFNPSPCADTNTLNPFSDPKMREAMNWLVDRNYIAQQVLGGLGIPRTLAISSSFADYSRYIDVAGQLETQYAYNPDKAKQVITAEMTTLGATMDAASGKWQYKGKPVTLDVLIRTEDKRKDIGDYVATQLENIGFTVTRDYKTRSEASPIWNSGDPTKCLFNIYTGGWINTAISRDDGTNFGFYYTPLGGSTPLWQHYTPSADFTDVANKLWNNTFSTMDERGQLFKQALTLSMQDSVRVWLVDLTTFTPMVSKLQVANDLAAGVDGGRLWPYTVRYKGQVGGDVKVAQPGILVDPWNPVAGTSWVYDLDVQAGVGEFGAIADPFTGLYWPQRIAKADVTVKTGLPVTKTLDWLTLNFADNITVPNDAWVDWDAKAQKFITAADKGGGPITANVKVTVTYPANLFKTVSWQDGSPLTMGDFIMAMILTFDPAKTDSPIYDEAQVPNLEAFMSHFKGVKIESTNPLTISTYDDLFQLDAETLAGLNTWWPTYNPLYPTEASWDSVAIGYLADSQKKLAFSTDKASANKVDWMNYVAGPSLDILNSELTDATSQSFIPYAPTMGQYVKASEAKTRYANLAAWYKAHGTFWVGTGPFFLDSVHSVEQTLTLKRNPNFQDTSDKWARFSIPKIAVVDVTGPTNVKIGDDAKFNVAISFNGAPYANSDLAAVKFLVFDATNTLVTVGNATAVSDGQYTVDLTPDITGKLASGSNKLEIAVSSKVVSLPTIVTTNFVTAP